MSRRRYIITTLVCAVLLVLATIAGARTQTARAAVDVFGAGYKATSLVAAGNQAIHCDGWSGGADGAGNTYLGCYNYVYRFNDSGQLTDFARLPQQYRSPRDVAATASGDVIYVATGPVPPLDQVNPITQPNYGKVIRMVRGSDNVWRQDTAFAAGPFPFTAGGTTSYWAARNVEVDLAGRVYITVNAYIYVLDGRTGKVIDRFGGDGRTVGAGGAYIDGLEVAMGLAVTPDGGTVYVVEQRHNHVQRWVRTNNGHDWARQASWQIGSGTRASNCTIGDTNAFASPYDVSLDGAGNLFVLDTTCRRLQKYRITNTGGVFLGSLWRNYPTDGNLYHGLAANYRGTVMVGQMGRRFGLTPGNLAAQARSCAPDSDAPRFTRLAMPGVVSGRGTSTISLAGTDGCSWVKSMRVEGGGAFRGPWRPYKRTMRVTLTAHDGVKVVQVSLQDAYGRITTRSVRTRRTTAPMRARGVIRLYGRGALCRGKGDPRRALANPYSYRIGDRCATFVGTVVKIQRRGGSVNVLLRLSMGTSQAMFTNVRTPQLIWLIGTNRTPTPRRLVVGRQAVVTSALLANRRLTTVYAVPVYQWYRR